MYRRNALWPLAASLLILLPSGAGLKAADQPAGGESPAGAQAETCRKAEVNPVTGHVLCLEPRGAPVSPPPTLEGPCKENPEPDADWTFGPKCKS